MYFVKSPKLFDWLYPEMIWRIQSADKKLYLTFDDGPDEILTPELLKILDSFNAKATFFCVGEKVKKSPQIINQIVEAGHSTGNHTFRHIKGKKTATEDFIEDVMNCDKLLLTKSFRPPFGSITRSQIKQLKDRFKIYMWTVMPGDFDENISKEKCLKRSIQYTKNGTIIIFHDNEKSKDKVLYTVPKYIEHFQKLGYTFEAL